MEPILVVMFFKKIIYLLKVKKNPTPQILEIYPTPSIPPPSPYEIGLPTFLLFENYLLYATNPTWKIVLLNVCWIQFLQIWKLWWYYSFKMHIVYIFPFWKSNSIVLLCNTDVPTCIIPNSSSGVFSGKNNLQKNRHSLLLK